MKQVNKLTSFGYQSGQPSTVDTYGRDAKRGEFENNAYKTKLMKCPLISRCKLDTTSLQCILGLAEKLTHEISSVCAGWFSLHLSVLVFVIFFGDHITSLGFDLVIVKKYFSVSFL